MSGSLCGAVESSSPVCERSLVGIRTRGSEEAEPERHGLYWVSYTSDKRYLLFSKILLKRVKIADMVYELKRHNGCI